MKSLQKKVKKAIFLVAGYGTRFLPATKAMPKEMLPVVDKPIVQYLVEQAVDSGIEEIIFVTGRGKHAIENHFDISYELQRTLVERNKLELLKLVEPLHSMAKFSYVRQPLPMGNGDAILRAKHLIGDGEPFAVFFGDDLFDAKVPVLKQLMNVFDRYQDPVIALAEVPRAALSQYGTVEGIPALPKGTWEIEKLVEKPKDTKRFKHPLAIVSPYVLPYEAFDALEEEQKAVRLGKRGKRAEVGLSQAIGNVYMKKRSVYGYEVRGTWYDCGSKIGYLKANIAFAMKRPELRGDLRKFIKNI